MKDIYDKVRGDMIHEPGDENNDIFFIKTKGGEKINDLFDQI